MVLFTDLGGGFMAICHAVDFLGTWSVILT